jgi:hypothetical protein
MLPSRGSASISEVPKRTVSTVAWVVLCLTALGYAACGGPQEPGAAGDECYRDADCKAGLVCVPDGSRRSCSNDVSGLVSMVEGPPIAEPPVDMDAAVVDDAGTSPEDAAPPEETGVPEEAGAGEPDAGMGEPDAGSGDPDAGMGEPDAGMGDPDAGTGEPDAG